MTTWALHNPVRAPVLCLGVAEVGLLFVSVYIAGAFVFGNLANCEQIVGPLFPVALTISLVILTCLIAMGLYQLHQRAYFREVIVRVVVAVLVGIVALWILVALLPTIRIPASFAAATLGFGLMFLLLIRYAFLCVVDDNVFRYRTLVYGAGKASSAILDLRRRADRRGFVIVGIVPAPSDAELASHNQILDDRRSLLEIAREKNADEIVIAMDDRRGSLPVQDLLDCKLRGFDVIDIVEFLERETGKIRIDLVRPGWLIFSPGFGAKRFSKLAKRAMDILVATVAILIFWPLMLLIALAIKHEDGWRAPVLYRQVRVGLFGNEFVLPKFRSMREDAEADGRPVWADENDQRVTRVGAILRKYRLDELPQFLNILRGEMSLVGPRPERPEFVNELNDRIPYYPERHTVKPGVTGWAQLLYTYGSSEDDAAEKLQYDLYYVKHQSLILDIMIVLQTVEIVLWGKGAR